MASNFGAAAEDYAAFRAGFPDSLFDRLDAFGIGRAGQLVVDVGTGTGALGRGFARRGARVIGIDPDTRMLEQARRLDAVEGRTSEYRQGRAERLPVADAEGDVVAAGQCWHWFDAPVAAREFFRATRSGGLVLVAHFDWLPAAGSVVEATERLIAAHNPAWRHGGGDGFHPECLPPLQSAGFRDPETFSYDVDVPYSPEAWRGRIRASAGVGASLSPDAVRAFDAEHAALLAASYPDVVLEVPHRVFCAVARRPL
jgi:SAM-dependent methyltransferase